MPDTHCVDIGAMRTYQQKQKRPRDAGVFAVSYTHLTLPTTPYV